MESVLAEFGWESIIIVVIVERKLNCKLRFIKLVPAAAIMVQCSKIHKLPRKLVDFLCAGKESISAFSRKRGKQLLQVESKEETMYNIKSAF